MKRVWVIVVLVNLFLLAPDFVFADFVVVVVVEPAVAAEPVGVVAFVLYRSMKEEEAWKTMVVPEHCFVVVVALLIFVWD